MIYLDNKKLFCAFWKILQLFFISILFTDPPEISVERPIVHSGEGFEAQLVCIVHGESQPEVSIFLIIYFFLNQALFRNNLRTQIYYLKLVTVYKQHFKL